MGWHPAIPEAYRNQIVCGDARELARAIPDESVDLVFTDPPYPKEYLPLYGWLAEEAARVLRPGGFALVYEQKAWHPEVLAMMSEHLEFYWPLCILEPGMNSRFWPKHILGGWRLVLMFRKRGSEAVCPYIPDGLSSDFREKQYHGWQQSALPCRVWTHYLTQPEDVIWEPFTGGGTTPAVCKQLGRNFIAFEIDPQTAEKARQRLHNTPLPLFVMDAPEPQAELEFVG